MKKFYAVAKQKMVTKNAEGKNVEREVDIVINLEDPTLGRIESRFQAEKAAKAIAKEKGLKFVAVHPVKTFEVSGGILTKSMQTHKRNGTMPKF